METNRWQTLCCGHCDDLNDTCTIVTISLSRRGYPFIESCKSPGKSEEFDKRIDNWITTILL